MQTSEVAESQKRTRALYHVGLKVLLKKGDEFLFLHCAANDGAFDLPGGRIDEVEHYTPLEEILAREIREELGEDFVYKLGKPVFQYRRHFENKGVHIFLTVYEAEYVSGEIRLSNEHSGFEWINPQTRELKLEDFQHKEEYEAFKKYFETPKNT